MPGEAGPEYAVSCASMETAPARKFKHPQGLKRDYTFRRGAPSMGGGHWDGAVRLVVYNGRSGEGGAAGTVREQRRANGR